MKMLLRRLLLCVVLGSSLHATSDTAAIEGALFRRYSGLQEKIAYISLGALPTPVQKLEKMGEALDHANLYIKRDDQTGAVFGGNKVRKLRFLLGEALAKNAPGVVTRGYAGSNHTTATAVYAEQLGLACICVHNDQEPTAYAKRNIACSVLHGADLQWFASLEERNEAYADLEKEGCYGIPSGGSNAVGALGFVDAVFELQDQIQAGMLPEPDYLFVAIGSCATSAGLALGIKLAGLKTQLVPICIEPKETPSHEEHMATLFNEASELLHAADASVPLLTLKSEETGIIHDYAGPEYAVITPEAYAAITLLAEKEGIKLDGTYSGKAFAAVIEAAQKPKMKDKIILFWDTFFSGSADDAVEKLGDKYRDLPAGYHRYFEAPIQTLDQGV